MYNLIEYSDNYSNTLGSLLYYYSYKPDADADDNIVEFTNANAVANSFKDTMKAYLCYHHTLL